MAGTVFETIWPILKERYEGPITDQINTDNVLLSELKVETQGIARDAGGRYVVLPLRIGRNTGAGPRPEDAPLPRADHRKYARAQVELTRQYASGRLTGFSEDVSEDNISAFTDALTDTIDSVREAMTQSLARQVHHDRNGVFARIAASGVTGTGPWTLELDSERAIVANFIEEGNLLQFVRVDGTTGEATPLYDGGSVEVTDVDDVNNEIVVAVDEGAPRPTPGDYIVIKDTANEALNGIESIVNADKPLQDVDPDVVRQWRAVEDTSGSTRTLSFTLLEKFTNKIRRLSGEHPDLVYARAAPLRDLYEEAGDSVRFVENGDDKEPRALTKGSKVYVYLGGKKVALKVDYQAAPGQLTALNTRHLKTYATGGFDWITQGGSNALVIERRDAKEFIMKRYMQIATDKRITHGRMTNLTDASAD